jgi:NAD(P)-dependent dehydrogenase (short-subunit alcohol dehydrogenase family)
MELGLAGRACVVTGASRGIGRETARMLAGEGARVLLVARGAEGLDEAVAACREGAGDGGEAASIALDVTVPDAADRIVETCEERFGPVEVLVNNAGTAKWRPLEEVPDPDWQAAWDVNVMAPMRLMRTIVPGMRNRRWGRVVNVASTAGKRPSALMPEYSVAKAAELSLSRLFADQAAGDGVLVNAICPGPFKGTRIGGGLTLQPEPELEEQWASTVPVRRMADPEELKGLVLLLASPAGSFITGAAHVIDGGAAIATP